MVCNRCILVVQQELQKLEIDTSKVTLEVATLADIPKEKLEKLQANLDALAFELLDKSKQQPYLALKREWTIAWA